MRPGLILGIDQGSSGTKGVLIDPSGKLIATFGQKVQVDYAPPRVEQNPTEIINSVKVVFDLARSKANELGSDLLTFGLAVQRSGVCAWKSDTLEILSPLLTHRDRRVAGVVESLQSQKEKITELTGLPLIPSFAGPKVALLQEKYPGSEVAVGTLDSLLVQTLTGRACTDDTMAARTMLYDISKRCWSPDLCKTFGVDIKRLLPIVPSFSALGNYCGVPLSVMIGDQQAALFGMQSGNDTDVVINLGTIGAVLVPLAQYQRWPGFVASVAYSSSDPEVPFHYLLEGVSPACGPLLDELAANVLNGNLVDIDDHCQAARDSNGARGAVIFWPHGGTGTPEWQFETPAINSGILNQGKGSAGSNEVCRAIVENIGGFLATNLLSLISAKIVTPDMKIQISGGVARSDYLCQFVADCTGVPLYREHLPEATAYGAAVAAAKANNYISTTGAPDPAVSDLKRIFEPCHDKVIAKARLESWTNLRKKATSKQFNRAELFGW